jgi:uncharacterized membrane protein YdjX (TVP38/TMEM64 family)
MNTTQSALPIVVILGALLGALVFFIICRELICWYLKTNRSVELLEEILRELQKSNENNKKIE